MKQKIMAFIALGFDMGIRNLAYCLMEHPADNGPWRILAWDNVDLLSGGESTATARKCVGCSGPSAYSHGTDLWCKSCATGVRRKKSAVRIPAVPVLPCTTKVVDLRRVGIEGGWATKTSKKEELLREATARYLMPWKAPKATQPSLADIRRQMDSWLDRMLPTFSAATLIRLENQPVMKGPTMKSIQIMLFTLLGHRLEREYGWRGEIVFVHAGVKTRGVELDVLEEGAADADAGAAYRARKKTAEHETISALEARGDGVAEWLTMFRGRSKKNDLADAFLMALRRGKN